MGVVVTQELLDAARKCGACDEGLAHKPGTLITSLPKSHLSWIEENLPDHATRLAKAASTDIGVSGFIPLTLLGDGDGSGSGYGYGSGSGSGYGYGDGDGYGDGSGDGSGSGDGDGDGYGDGDGSGDGSGDGLKDIVSSSGLNQYEPNGIGTRHEAE